MSVPEVTFDTFISVIVPIRDAARYVEETIIDLDRLVGGLFRHYEIVLVDDASSDATVDIIQRIQKTVGNIQAYCLNRRSGFDIALIAGLDNSIGDFVITLNVETDSYALIPRLWEKAQQGNEFVCGVRTDQIRGRLNSRLNRWFYRAFNAFTGITIPSGVSDLRLYSRRVVNYVTQNNDRHLLLKVLPFFVSHRVATIEYAALLRDGGFGNRSLSTSLVTAVAILLASSIQPLRLLTLIAILASSLSLLFAIYVVAIALFKQHVVEGWISLALPMAVMFFLMSVILGILSEYIYMLSQQSGNRPVYTIAQESTSSVMEIQRKLNVVEGGGDFSIR
jgi:glycosyltransferase involved in cell wall biosynthesis